MILQLFWPTHSNFHTWPRTDC